MLIHKAALDGPTFMRTDEYKDFEKKITASGMFAVGHNRAATRGTVEDKNAHPFWVNDEIVLVQNGTWKGDHTKVKETEVDTEVIAHLLHEEQDVEQALRKVDAAFALSWYDFRNRTLNFIRNYERPLFKATLQSGAILFASEEATIRWAVKREDMAFKHEPKLLDPYVHNTFLMKEDGQHTEGEKKLDAMFRSKSTTNYGHNPHQPWRRQAYAGVWGDCDYSEEEEDTPTPTQHVVPVVTQHRSSSLAIRTISNPAKPNLDPAQVDYTFADIARVKLTEYHGHSAVITLQADAVQRAKGEKITVALEDYLPANDHHDCKVWFVFGSLASAALDAGKPSPIVYWVMHGEESEIIEACTKVVLYVVSLGTIQAISFLNDHNNRIAVSYVFGVGATPVVQPQLIKEESVHVVH
jgi:hypothetical protein